MTTLKFLYPCFLYSTVTKIPYFKLDISKISTIQVLFWGLRIFHKSFAKHYILHLFNVIWYIHPTFVFTLLKSHLQAYIFKSFHIWINILLCPS